VSKVLITGAGGYIGGRLVAQMLSEGFQVHGLNRDPAPRLPIDLTVCDLAHAEEGELAAACRGVETIVHLAGENEVLAAREPARALAETLVATERLSEAGAAAGVRRLVYLSTVHVYGERMTPGAVLTEDMRPEPRGAYAISRLASEHVTAAVARGAYELLILRLTNSVGAPDHPSVDRWTLVANDLCRQGATSRKLRLLSSGAQWRVFVSLSAVCRGLSEASRIGPTALAPGVYNLGSGRPTTVRGLAEMVQDEFERQTGGRPPLEAPDPEPDAPGPYRVSVERAAALGIRLDDPLREAVAETVRFCLDHQAELP